MKKLLFGTLAALLLGLPQAASAACPGCTCTVTTTAVAFGIYDPFSPTDHDAAGNVNVACTVPLLIGILVTYNVKLDKGSYSSTLSTRQMDNGNGNRLDYNLYTNSSRSTIWGDDTEGYASRTISKGLLSLISFNDDLPVYGRIPAGQTSAAAGNYSDSVLVTVTY